MARKSITTIEEKNVESFLESAEYRKELPCDRITGFHLQKLAKGATWRFRYRGLDNKWKIINLGKVSAIGRIEAAKEARLLSSTVDAGGDPVHEREQRREQQRIAQQKAHSSTLRAFFNDYYIPHYKGKRDGQGSIQRIEYHFHKLHDLFDRQLISLSRQDVHAWQRKCWDFICPTRPHNADGSENRKHLSHATIQRVFNALKTLLNLAVQEEVISHNPLTHPSRVKLLAPNSSATSPANAVKAQGERRALTSDELAAIRRGIDAYREECRGKRLRSAAKGNANSARYCDTEQAHPNWFFPFFELAAYSGAPSGDLYTLTWQELLLDECRISYSRNKTADKAIDAGKKPLVINIHMNQRIMGIMREWHRQQGSPDSGLVFPSERRIQKGVDPAEAVLDKNAHDDHWYRVRELGGVSDKLVFYSLRHHFISVRVADGRPMFEVARMVGHRSTKMIEENYGHLAPDAAKEAMADKFDFV